MLDECLLAPLVRVRHCCSIPALRLRHLAPIDRRTIVRHRMRMTDDGQYLAKLRDYYARHRVLPSYSRIGTLVGLSSKASVAELVLRLKAEGFVESTPDRRLKPGRRFFERLVAESVQAGLPTLAPDMIEPETITID